MDKEWSFIKRLLKSLPVSAAAIPFAAQRLVLEVFGRQSVIL